MKRNIQRIDGGRVSLRLVKRNDLKIILTWRNQPEIRRWFINSAIISLQDHLAWFERYFKRNNDFIFIIIENETNEPVGQVSLYNIDWVEGTCEFGRIMIGEDWARGRGLAKEASKLLILFAKETLGIRTISLEVLANNQPAISIYKSLGFKETNSTNSEKNLLKMTL